MKVALTMGLSVALATASAIANSPFRVQAALITGSSPSDPVVTCVETAPNSGIWDIEIALANAAPPANGEKAQLTILVENFTPGPGTGDKIGIIRIDAKDHFPFDGKADLEVRLQLGGTDPLTADIDWIGLGDSVFDTDLLLINPSFVKGSVGTIAVNWIENLFIDGDVAEILTGWNQGGVYAGTANSISNLTVTGDVTGTIYVGHGTADRIAVTGDVGSPTNQATILVRSHLPPGVGLAIGEFSCRSMAANFQVGLAYANGLPEVRRIAIGGNQHGFLFLPLALYRETPPLEIAGDVAGEVVIGSAITFTVDDRAIRVFGDIQASGSVKVAKWADTLPVTQPKTIVGIGGTVWGRLVLGSPLVTGSGGIYPGNGTILGGFTQEIPAGVGASGILEFRGDINADGVINISGGFAGEIRIAEGLNLAGQVIINSDASGSDLFTGSAVLDFDTFPVSLTPIPNYTNLSAELGGGAIGVVPFNLHAPDCEPPSGSLITVHTGLNGIQAPQEVRIRHYGPVRFASAGAQLLVERSDFTYSAPPIGPTIWEDVSASYQFAASSENPRDLIVSGNFGPDYRYRIRPNGQVLCAGNSILDAGSFPVFDYTYNLRVRTPLDRNMNGMMEFGDIELQVADPIDINGDTAADVLDLAEVIQAVANP